jgi:hypothetical protein
MRRLTVGLQESLSDRGGDHGVLSELQPADLGRLQVFSGSSWGEDWLYRLKMVHAKGELGESLKFHSHLLLRRTLGWP